MVVDEVQREGAGERKRKKERQWERERGVGGGGRKERWMEVRGGG